MELFKNIRKAICSMAAFISASCLCGCDAPTAVYGPPPKDHPSSSFNPNLLKPTDQPQPDPATPAPDATIPVPSEPEPAKPAPDADHPTP